MNDSPNRYHSYRLRLEILKQNEKTWILIVLARLLLLLAIVAVRCL